LLAHAAVEDEVDVPERNCGIALRADNGAVLNGELGLRTGGVKEEWEKEGYQPGQEEELPGRAAYGPVVPGWLHDP